MIIKKTTGLGTTEDQLLKPNWLNARDLYRDLMIPEFHQAFEDWFTSRIQGEYQEGVDWKVEFDGEEPTFWITELVDAEVANDERGLPIIKVRRMSEDAAELGWNEENNPQTHAITGDDEI